MENRFTIIHNIYTYIRLYNSNYVQGWAVPKSQGWAEKKAGYGQLPTPATPKVRPGLVGNLSSKFQLMLA